MSSFADAETFVFWDMNECKIPNDLKINSLCKNIKSALANEGYCGKVSIRAYGTKNHIGDELLLPEGFTFITENIRIREDSVLEVYRFIPFNLMLIVHDDALYNIHSRNGINILIAQNVINLSVVQAAASVWVWKSLSSGGSPTSLNESGRDVNISLTTMISNETKKSTVRSADKTIKISDSIPKELILEILSRLPAKSVARFCCVSKLWASIFGGPYFTELFLTRPSARPRLLFALEEDGVWSFFSLPQRQNSSSSLVTAEFHMKFSPDNRRIYSHRSRRFSCGYCEKMGLSHFSKAQFRIQVDVKPKTEASFLFASAFISFV